jgi:hypothetical protein
MTFDLTKILASKRAHRRELAALPVAEKLRMLDALRERDLDIRRGRSELPTGVERDSLAPVEGHPRRTNLDNVADVIADVEGD